MIKKAFFFSQIRKCALACSVPGIPKASTQKRNKCLFLLEFSFNTYQRDHLQNVKREDIFLKITLLCHLPQFVWNNIDINHLKKIFSKRPVYVIHFFFLSTTPSQGWISKKSINKQYLFKFKTFFFWTFQTA